MSEQTAETTTEEQLSDKLQADIDKVIAGDKTYAEVLGFTGEYLYQIAGMGYKLLQEGNYDDAEGIFRGLVRLNPKDPNLHMWLGSTLHRRGQVAEAIKSYSNALGLEPENATCLANRGELMIVEGLAEDGTKDLMQAIELDPEGKEPATVRARAILATIAQKIKEKGVV
ncbi:MAG: tetratricopeptide repeat protein [Planctomycetota bacterium]|jgi:Flp pilus assembly protein TadD